MNPKRKNRRELQRSRCHVYEEKLSVLVAGLFLSSGCLPESEESGLGLRDGETLGGAAWVTAAL
jgi:hypothetical protein